MLNIVLFGPPGSGKGTQAQNLITRYGLIHISTGDLLRNEIKNSTPLGLEAKGLMDAGKLVPDALVIGMIKNKLSANLKTNGFIFDGFPRTIAQAEALDSLLADINAEISLLLSLKVRDEELIKRLLLRGETSQRSDDQNEAIIRNRIEVYKNETQPVAGYYEKQGKLRDIYGEGSIEVTFDLLIEQIDKFQ